MQYTALLISFNARIFSVHNKTRLRALTTLSIQDQGAWQGGGWRRGFWLSTAAANCRKFAWEINEQIKMMLSSTLNE